MQRDRAEEVHVDNWAVASIVLAGISTLAIFSFLIKENRFYRLFEHLFIGIAAGYLPIVTVKTFLWPQVFEPMLGFNTIVFPDGTVSTPYNPLYLLYLLPFAFGLLYYFIYSKRHAWIAKVVIGFSLGASAGLSFQGFFAEIIPQIFSSFKPLVVFEAGQIDWMTSFNHTLFIVILFSVMYYFFFTFRRESRILTKTAYVGRFFMMVCFGAFFGSTVMARMALLVERLQFLLNTWAPTITSLF